MAETPPRTWFTHSNSLEEPVGMAELEKDFTEYVKKKSKTAKDGLGQDAQYIPSVALADFWQLDQVRDILTTLEIKEHPEHIIDQFIRIFSILVYIGNPRDIGLFTPRLLDDQHLPITSQPTDWPDTPNNDSLFQKFYKYQWRFCPLEFRNGYIHKRLLEPQMILPVKYEEQLSYKSGGGEDSIVWKVQIDDDCNEKLPSSTVVFKVYQTDEAKDFYKAEVDTYTSFPDEYGEYMAKCYGCFEQNGKHTIILEYAPQGTLLDFWKKTRLPRDTEELTNFWTALFQLLQGLDLIHEMLLPNTTSRYVWTVTHNDIKPANILVFPDDSQESGPYGVRFKLADFGTAQIAKKLAGAEHTPMVANTGNRMYSAPESCRLFPVQDLFLSRVDRSIDVWALGAIFSETLIWTVWGEEGRERYRLHRKNEIAQIEQLRGTGYDACFHNGTDKLAVVDVMHASALNHTRKNDALSEIVSELILDGMLKTRREGRWDPIPTLSRAMGKLRGLRSPKSTEPPRIQIDVPIVDHHAERVSDVNSPLGSTGHSFSSRPKRIHSESEPTEMPGMKTIDSSGPQYGPSQQDYNANHHQRSISLPEKPNSELKAMAGNVGNGARLSRTPPVGRETSSVGSSTERKVTFKEVYDLLMRKNNRPISLGRMMGSKRGLSVEVMTLPGIQEALSKISALGPREQLILIDDYESMKQHKVDVQVAARVISYYVKEVDPNKMELYFASKINNPSKFETSSSLEAAIRAHEFVPGFCAMNLYLSNILRNIMINSKYGRKPFSVYVFTDAVWEPSDPEVDRVIAEAAQQLVKMRLPAQHIMIQFIRFGEGDVEGERLRKLDDDLVKDFKLDKAYDIVDTKSYEDSVPDILIGSISRFNDLKNSGRSYTGNFRHHAT